MCTLALLAAAFTSGCSLTADFDAPFPGAADSGPRAEQGAADLSPADRSPADLSPADARPEDGGVADEGPSRCDEGAVRASRRGPGGGAWLRERCVDGAWRPGRCTVQPPFACGAQTFTYPGGQETQQARYVCRPNLQGRAAFHTVEGALRVQCDGCVGRQPAAADGVFDQEFRLVVAADGRAITRPQWRGQPLVSDRRADFRYLPGRVEERLMALEGGVLQRLDVHRVEGDPPCIVETQLGVTEAAPQGVSSLTYGYGPFDELRTVIVTEPDGAQGHRRYTYGDDGEWVRLEIREGGADAPLSAVFVFDASCLACADRECTYDVPEGCAHVPLRLGPRGFQGGWPSALFEGGGQDFARRRCQEAGWGRLARFDTRFDLEWVWQVAGPGGLIRVGGHVDAEGVARWDVDDAPVPAGLLGGEDYSPGDCLALGPGVRLRGLTCAQDPGRAPTRFLCERRPG